MVASLEEQFTDYEVNLEEARVAVVGLAFVVNFIDFI